MKLQSFYRINCFSMWIAIKYNSLNATVFHVFLKVLVLLRCGSLLWDRHRLTLETDLSLIYSHLRLDVISSDNVSYSSQGRGGNLIVCVPADREVHREKIVSILQVRFTVTQITQIKVWTYMSSSTRRLQTPESMTAWILSLGPSER